MTDDEINQDINRQVAEIEGWRQVGNREAGRRWMPPGTPPEFNIAALPFFPPPYVTDWAWCGPLIEKYGIDLHWQPDDENGDRWMAYSFGINGMLAETPQIAICVAVMAANQHRPPTARTWTGLGDK